MARLYLSPSPPTSSWPAGSRWPSHSASRSRAWHGRWVLVEIVLAAGENDWRKRSELPALPAVGTIISILDSPTVLRAVAGSVCELAGGGDRAAVAAVLVRAADLPQAPAAELRRAGWHLLV